jgi:predicted transcriptional regulator
LTASFRDLSIGPATIAAVGRLARDYSQAEIARWMGCSPAMVGKIVRAYAYSNPTEFQP